MNEKEQTEGSIELCAVCGTARNDGGWHDFDFCIAVLEARISTLRNVKLKLHQDDKVIADRPPVIAKLWERHTINSASLRAESGGIPGQLIIDDLSGQVVGHVPRGPATIDKESFLKP